MLTFVMPIHAHVPYLYKCHMYFNLLKLLPIYNHWEIVEQMVNIYLYTYIMNKVNYLSFTFNLLIFFNTYVSKLPLPKLQNSQIQYILTLYIYIYIYIYKLFNTNPLHLMYMSTHKFNVDANGNDGHYQLTLYSIVFWNCYHYYCPYEGSKFKLKILVGEEGKERCLGFHSSSILVLF
jgi:hypothetical protein